MGTSTFDLVLHVFLALFVGTLLALYYWGNRRAEKAWSAFARKHGLTNSGGLLVHGVYEGWALSITTGGHSSSDAPVTVFWLHLDGILPGDFLLLPTLAMRLPHDKPPEHCFWPVRGISSKLSAQLSGAAFQELERLASSYGYISIQDGALIAKKLGIPHSVAQMESCLAPLVATARLLDEVTGGTRAQRALKPERIL